MATSKATVSGDFGDLIRGAESAAKSIANLGLQMSGIKTAAKAFDVATSAVGGLINGLGKIGLAASGIEAIGNSAASMGMALLKGNAALEMTTISFQTLLGSASAAQDMIKQLTTFAQQTPFELAGLEASTQRLLAFGFSAKEIIPLMTSMGDAISALGGTQDNLNSLVYVMGQMRQEAHINAGDIMQMTNLGIPALQMLADHYHKTTGEIQDMISKGLIPGTDAVKIFSDGMEKKYGGMMAAQSATFSGMLSNLQDWFSATTIILTKPLFEPAKKALQAFLNFVQSPAGVAVINRMALEIQKAVDAATKAFIQFEPRIKPTLERLLQVANAIRIQMTPGFLTLIPLLGQLWTRVEPLAVSFYKFYQAVQPLSIALAALRGYITGGLTGALAALQSRFSMISGYVQIGINAALVEVRRFGPAALSWISETAISIARQALTWGEALIEWVAPYATRLVSELINLGGQALNWVVGYTPVLANQALIWAEAIAGWVIPAIPRVLNALLQFGTGVLTWIEQEVPYLTGQVLQWTEILASWIIPAIPGVVRALEQLGAAIVNWGINRLPILMGQVVVGIGKGLGMNLQEPVADILKIFYALVNSIRSTVIPAFEQMVKFLSTNLMPLLTRFANFTAGTIIPTLASLAAFVMTTVVPIFVRIADVVGLIFGPALTLIGSIIRNELLPALSDSWVYFDGKYMPTVRDLAAAFGEKLAGSIRQVTDKIEAALPSLESFYKKIEPIVGKALDLYKAISPLSIALDVLKGFLTGGLQGGFGALEQHIVDAGKALGVNLQPAIDWFNSTIVKNAIPTLQSWASTFINEWWPTINNAVTWVSGKIADFINFVTQNVWPPMSAFLTWMGGQGVVLWNSISDTLTKTVIPAVKDFIHWIADVLWPTFRDDVFPWIDKNVRPTLEHGFEVLSTKIIPWIGDMVDIVLNHVIPALVAWWGVLFTLINPFLTTVANTINTVVLPAMSLLYGSADDNKKGIEGIVDGFKTFMGIVGGVVNGFHLIWEAMGGWLVESVISNIGKIITMLGLMGDTIDALGKGDYVRAVTDMMKVKTIWSGSSQTISGSGNNTDNAAQVRLQQYMMAHPNYDPKAAGNAHAAGTMNAPGGLSLVGEKGMELIHFADKFILAARPMLLNLPKGAQVFNNRETLAMLPSPASAQQISNMYATSNANRSWDYSQTTANSNNTTNHNYYGQGQAAVWSPGQQYKWYGGR